MYTDPDSELSALFAQLPPLSSFAEALRGERDLLFRTLGYTFWNRELLDALAARLRREAPDRWLELAAGTGRWTAELLRRGLVVTATDKHAQEAGQVQGHQRVITYGRWVERLTAAEAMERYRPRGVLCAWPPLGSCLLPDLLSRTMAGGEALQVVVAIGDPNGATEALTAPHELPPGWTLETWPECEQWLVGFNDPPAGSGWRSHSRLLVYRRFG